MKKLMAMGLALALALPTSVCAAETEPQRFEYLKQEIKNYCEKNQIKAATVLSSVGCLYELNIRLAGGQDYLNKKEAFEIIEKVITGDFIVIGSSMGGWLAMLAAIKYPKRAKGLIGLAAAPNFVKFFSSQITQKQKKELKEKGFFKIVNNDFCYTITEKFVETALASCLPEDKKWPILCPVHLIQGMKDASLPWKLVLNFAEQITSDQLKIKLLKSSNHRLNDTDALEELKSSIANIVNI